MTFYLSANPPTNQKLTKSLTEIVKTGTPNKTCRPKRGGTQTNLLVKTRWQARAVRPAAYAFASRDSAKP